MHTQSSFQQVKHSDLALCNPISLIQHFPGPALVCLGYFNYASTTDQRQLIGRADL